MATRHSKRHRETATLVDRDHKYTPAEAVELVKQAATANFDETVELHLRTNADPRHADQQLRGVANLPAGLGKPVRVAVFAVGEGVRLANEAGAEVVGGDDLVERIEGGFMEFDVAIATPDLMGRIGRLGRLLGRRGLMPNPRTGTVVQQEDIPSAVQEAKKGRIELRMDRTAIIHAPLGKVSFEDERLVQNLAAVVDTINRLRPAGVKGQFIKTVHLTSSMGPSVPMDLAATLTMKVE